LDVEVGVQAGGVSAGVVLLQGVQPSSFCISALNTMIEWNCSKGNRDGDAPNHTSSDFQRGRIPGKDSAVGQDIAPDFYR
jgi:hypothetical protein